MAAQQGVSPDVVIESLATKIARLEVANSMLTADRDAWQARAEDAEAQGGMVGGTTSVPE